MKRIKVKRFPAVSSFGVFVVYTGIFMATVSAFSQTAGSPLERCTKLAGERDAFAAEKRLIDNKTKVETLQQEIADQKPIVQAAEDDLADARRNRITPAMQQGREDLARDLQLEWDPRWGTNYVLYFEAIVRTQRKKLYADEGKLVAAKKLPQSDLNGPDLELRGNEVSRGLGRTLAQMQSAGCDAILAVPRAVTAQAGKSTAAGKPSMVEIEALHQEITKLEDQWMPKPMETEASKKVQEAAKLAAKATDLYRLRKASRDKVSGSCMSAAAIGTAFKDATADAVRKEELSRQVLAQASRLASSCSNPAEAEKIRANYRISVQKLAEIGVLHKHAVGEKKTLDDTKKAMADWQSAVKAGEAEVTMILKWAKDAEALVDKQIKEAHDKLKGIQAMVPILSARHADLLRRLPPQGAGNEKTQLQLARPRLDNVAALVPLDLTSQKRQVSASATAVLQAKTDLAALSKQGLSNLCVDVSRVTQEGVKAIDELDAMVVVNTAHVRQHAALLNRADDCVRGDKCAAHLRELGGLVERGDPKAAEKAREVKAAGCNVTETIEFYKTVRQTAALLTASMENCNFEGALKLAEKIPDAIKTRPLVADAIRVAQAGKDAAPRIAKLRADARAAVAKSGRNLSATSFLNQAKQAAVGIPCLEREVEQFRKEFSEPDKVMNGPVTPPPPTPPTPDTSALPPAQITCKGSITANPEKGYTGTSLIMTIVIETGNVDKVMLRSNKVLRQLAKTGANTWSEKFNFTGRGGDFVVTFDAFDVNGKNVCTATKTVRSLGLDPKRTP